MNINKYKTVKILCVTPKNRFIFRNNTNKNKEKEKKRTDTM